MQTYLPITRGPIFRNYLSLWGKYFFDQFRGKNTFLNFGKNLRPVKRLVTDRPLTVWFPTTFFLDRGLAWQTTIARAMEIRGHRIVFSHFDITFPRRNGLYFDLQDRGFIMPYYRLYTNALLSGFRFNHKPFSHFGNGKKFQQYRSYLEKFSLTECKTFVYHQLQLGMYVQNPLIHYFRCSQTTSGPEILDAWKDFLAIGMVMVDTFERAFYEIKPSILFILNGSFLDSRSQPEIAKRLGIRVITFEAGFMWNTLMLGINEPIINFPMKKYLPIQYRTHRLTPSQDEQLNIYLQNRSKGEKNIFNYWKAPIFDDKKIRAEISLSSTEKPDILFTNLLWDSALLDCDIAFTNQIEWIRETIAWYAKHLDRKLLIRIHPAEINPHNLSTTERIEVSLREYYPILPSNVIVIPPSSKISSYPLTALANLSIVYSSTAGIEAAMMGKPVIVAGKTHYRGQGFTHDITNRTQYYKLLSQPVLPTVAEELVAAARKYSFFFFFGYNIPFPLVLEHVSNFREPSVEYNFTDEQQLLPGKQAELDFIIDVLLSRRDYSDRLRLML